MDCLYGKTRLTLEIDDLVHAKEEIWVVGKACFAGDRQRTPAWNEDRSEELTDGRWDILLVGIGLQKAGCEEAARGLEYVRQHCHRMRNREFRTQGLRFGSGVIEAGCKLPRQFSVGLTNVQDFGAVSGGDARDTSGGVLASVSQARIRRCR